MRLREGCRSISTWLARAPDGDAPGNGAVPQVLDTDQSGEISFDEFYSWYVRKQNPPVKPSDSEEFVLEVSDGHVLTDRQHTMSRSPGLSNTDYSEHQWPESPQIVAFAQAGEHVTALVGNQKKPLGPVNGMRLVTSTGRESPWVGDKKFDPKVSHGLQLQSLLMIPTALSANTKMADPKAKAKGGSTAFTMAAAPGYEVVGLQFFGQGQCPAVERLLQRPHGKPV